MRTTCSGKPSLDRRPLQSSLRDVSCPLTLNVFKYIETFYNPVRLHQSPCCQSPCCQSPDHYEAGRA